MTMFFSAGSFEGIAVAEQPVKPFQRNITANSFNLQASEAPLCSAGVIKCLLIN